MKVRFWGVRGSLATPGRDTARYGGNTACVHVQGSEGSCVVLDAGTGIRALGNALPAEVRRVDVLLSHLHMDHIQGLGFFAPLYDGTREVHLWGPASATQSLRSRLLRYLSAPLFPVPLRDLPSRLIFHEVEDQTFQVGEFQVTAARVCHPGPTLGFRIQSRSGSLAYLPDHEPAMADRELAADLAWISGAGLACGVDLLIHDAQYTDAEYAERVGWGHSSLSQAFRFVARTRPRRFVPFHYDPAHDDAVLDRLFADAVARARPECEVVPAREGLEVNLGSPASDRL